MQQNSVFEPIQALVVPSGYVHTQPERPLPSSNQQAYGQFSNARGSNNVPMNKREMAHGSLPSTRDQRVSTEYFQTVPVTNNSGGFTLVACDDP